MATRRTAPLVTFNDRAKSILNWIHSLCLFLCIKKRSITLKPLLNVAKKNQNSVTDCEILVVYAPYVTIAKDIFTIC